MAHSLARVQKVKKRIMREWRKIKSWRKLAEQYPPVKFGTLQRFATDPDYVPVDDTLLIALGVKTIRKYKPAQPTSPRWWRELRRNAICVMAKQTKNAILERETI